jgi:hypothetical protein
MKTEMIAALTSLARQRQAELDSGIVSWREEAGAGVRLWCGPRCGNCCTLTVNCTLAEAPAIRSVLDDRLRERLAATVEKIISHARLCRDARTFFSGYRRAVGPCPYLDDSANCSIYAERPLACRALLSTRPTDWCGVNLAELPEFERDAFLASLDRNMVAFPTHYAAAPQELAANLERGLMLAMIRTFGFSVTGNLPVLVWLTGQKGFDALMDGSPATFLKFVVEHRIDYPYLMQVDVP